MAIIEPFYAHLGHRVREWRTRRGLTQAAVGARLAPPVTRASIANLELGKQRVLAHTLMQLAAVLDAKVADLLPAPATESERWAALEKELIRALHIPANRATRLASRLGAPK